MRIAVTGAGGQIGGQVVRLVAGGQAHRVVALSLSPPAWLPSQLRRHASRGTALEYAGITPAGHCAEMAIAGEDPWWYAYSTMFASIREQRRAAVSDEVRRLTGCSPAPVRETLASCKTA